MRTRTAIMWTAHRVRLTVGSGFSTMLVCVALSACSGSSTPPSSVLSPTSHGATSSATSTATASTASSSTSESPANENTSQPPSPAASVSESPLPEFTTPSPEAIPTQAPVTGGGGTAGFQDAGLAVLGGAAILAGLGSIAYRRRMTRKR